MTVTLDLAKLRPISVPLELNVNVCVERVSLTMRDKESSPLPFPRDV